MRTLRDRRRQAGITLVEIAFLMALALGMAMAISGEPLVAISADAKIESSRSAAAR
jgi:hypothetical protein